MSKSVNAIRIHKATTQKLEKSKMQQKTITKCDRRGNMVALLGYSF